MGVPFRLSPTFSSLSEEWITPPHILAVAEMVLGDIDLDPCADDAHTIPARVHYTRERDGLSQPWFGRVYMNPPYGKQIRVWVERICSAYETGEIEEGVALVCVRPDTRWSRRLDSYPRCFLHTRLSFGGGNNKAPFPSMLVYLGPDVARFAQETAHLGVTYCRYEPCRIEGILGGL
jgi:hypothetical protein